MPESLLELELDAILQSSRDNIVVCDGEGRVLKANARCSEIYGTEPGYFLGKSVYQLEREGILRPSVTAQVIEQRAKVQTMQRSRSGRLVCATGIPVFDPTGALVRVVSSSYDLTEIELLREEYERLQARAQHPNGERAAENGTQEIGGIVFRSRAMRELVLLVQRVADSDATVLFLGESGVGKTALARFLHDSSRRRRGRFVALNCGAVPEALFESEMFGYEAGAFTGARRSGKPGLIELANGGTLFLDEIGDLPLPMQGKLLKVLEDRCILRVGGSSERQVDLRIVASTNRELKTLIAQGQFRTDLYYRLSVFPVAVPALRARRDDIPVLTSHYLSELNARYAGKKSLTPGALAQLLEDPWPGNIRELKNILERRWLSTPGDRIDLGASSDGPATATAITADQGPHPANLSSALEQLERRLLAEARRHCRTTYEIADYLGISQPSVVRKLRKHGFASAPEQGSRPT